MEVEKIVRTQAVQQGALLFEILHQVLINFHLTLHPILAFGLIVERETLHNGPIVREEGNELKKLGAIFLDDILGKILNLFILRQNGLVQETRNRVHCAFDLSRRDGLVAHHRFERALGLRFLEIEFVMIYFIKI